MAFITRHPKPGAHCKDFKPTMYNKKICDLSDECKWEEQEYARQGSLRKCSGIKKDIIYKGIL